MNKVYQILASQLERKERLESRRNTSEALNEHYVDACNILEYCRREHLPSGSGLDRGTTLADAKESDTRDVRIQFAIRSMADRLKDEFEETCLENLDGFRADLMNWSLAEVNWREIAKHFIHGEVSK